MDITYDRNWTWIVFEDKPEESIRKALKEMGALFSFKRKAWYIRAKMPETVIRDAIKRDDLVRIEPVKRELSDNERHKPATTPEPIKSRIEGVFIQPPNPIKPGLSIDKKAAFIAKGVAKFRKTDDDDNLIYTMVNASRSSNAVTLQSNNIERGFIATVESAGDDFNTNIPADKVKLIKWDNVTCKDNIIISNGNTIKCLPGEYPTMNIPSDLKPISGLDNFWLDFDKVKRAASTDLARPVLMGIFIGIDNGVYSGMAAADGFVVHTTTSSKEGIIIPCGVLSEISTYRGDLELSHNKEYALLNCNGLKVVTLLIQGKYPEISKVVPSSNEYNQVNRKEFIQALKTCKVFAREGADKVAINFNGKCILSSSSEGLGSVSRSLEYSGNKELTIYANVDRMLDAINSIKGETLNMGFGTNVTPIDLLEDNLHIVVMPMEAR